MRSHGIYWCVLAFLAAATPRVCAQTDTWDGGGLNDLIITSPNWVDNTAPASSLLLTDLIFAGGLRRTPIFSAPFGAHRIEFDESAATFTLLGAELSIGFGGIANTSGVIQAFATPVTFAWPVGLINVFSGTGGLTFANIVTLPPGGITLHSSGPTNFLDDIAGTQTIFKTDLGTATWKPTQPADCNLVVQQGTWVMGADGETDVFSSTGTVNVSGTSTFRMEDSLTFDGGTIHRATGATLALTTGKTLALQNGAAATIDGAFGTTNAAIITVTGSGSTFSTTDAFGINGGATLNVMSGADISSSGEFFIGTGGGTSVATIDGTGSSMTAESLDLGENGNTGTVTFINVSTGSFGAMNIANLGAFAHGTLNIQNGATVAGSGNLAIATTANGQTGTLTITGANSALTLTGAVSATIGAANGNSGVLNIQNGGSFDSGTGTVIVRATGSVSITGGHFHAHGGLSIQGGQLTSDAMGSVTVDGPLIVDTGGELQVGGSFDSLAGFQVGGAGSTFTTIGDLAFGGGNVPQIGAGGAVSSNGQIRIGVPAGFSIAVVDGVGSSLTGDSLRLGNGAGGTIYFTNGSIGTFGTVSAGVTSNGFLGIESGADVTATGLVVATAAANITGTVTVTGTGSHLEIEGAGTATIGAPFGSVASLNVLSAGSFSSGTGFTTVNSTGSISINSGSYESRGNLTLNGGQLTRAALGSLYLTPGTTLTVTGGGDAILTGNFTNSTASTITISGTDSTLSTTGNLVVNGGSTLNVVSGGSATSGSALVRAGYDGNGTIVVDGIGSSLSGGFLGIGQGNNNNGSITFSNGSTGTFTDMSIDFSGNAGTNGTMNIQSGASVAGTSLAIAISEAVNSGVVTITGAGSSLTISGHTEIGAASASTATINVLNGGTLNCGDDAFTLRATGTININGGIVNLNGPLVREGGAFNFTAGELHMVDEFTVGASGLLGTGVVLDNTRQLVTTGKVTIESSAVLTFHGGTFSASTLTSNGDLNFSNGNTNVNGEVTLIAGSHVTMSGMNTVTTFANEVIHNGSEILVGAGASGVFAGVQSGSGSFTGPGTIRFDGNHEPGSPRALVSFGGDVIYGPSATLQLQLGGIVRGTGYDALNVDGNLAVDGTMNVVLVGGFQPAPGLVFNLFDWGTISGGFDTINLPALGGGLDWNTSQLYLDGTLLVVPEPTCAALFIVAAGGLLGRFKLRPTMRSAALHQSQRRQGTRMR